MSSPLREREVKRGNAAVLQRCNEGGSGLYEMHSGLMGREYHPLALGDGIC